MVFTQTEKKRSPTPGPGQYSAETRLDTVRDKAKTFKMSKSTKDINYDNKMPGVGKYNSEKSTKKTPTYSIPKEKRKNILQIVTNENVPGPGYYSATTKNETTANKKFTFGSKFKDNFSKTPGPGHYEANKNKIIKSASAWKIGSSKRYDNFSMTVAGEGAIVSKNLMLNTPGPGKYQINEEKGKTFKFTKDEKMKSLKSFSPGPGYYKIPCSMVDVPRYVGGKFVEEFKYV